ncbi:PLDc N-terminal domain-containing protein [Caenispirillum salinarum]|uniref:PLDc N-terminal domain-containing protein n=1 Tax=Caenispirillum salinarum TaxID=859058 RepID=UPI00384D0883
MEIVEIGGIFGLLLLIADVWAIVNVIGSNRGTGAKVLWILAILIFPLLGFLVWLIFGPRSAKSVRS